MFVDPSSMPVDLQKIPLSQIVGAIGGLGTAAFGVVDASRAVIPGIDRIGLKHIEEVVASLVPDQTGEGLPAKPVNTLPRRNVLATVGANWINGNDLASQKAIAKSLIKLHMSPGNAAALAARTNVDPVILRSIATKISTGASLTQAEVDVYARFDLIVTALLDEAYQRSDQKYRNRARGLAALVAVLLAVAAGWSLTGNTFWASQNFGLSVLVGLLATPLAPVAKDLSSALAAAVNAMQVVKRK
ncbi:MAG: hypothetical protein ABSF28_13715 [Terracidiphilus sp.]|jgi:hypothetical protein